MKITVEFNSVEEILTFASAFGKTGFVPQYESVQAPAVEIPKENKQPIETKVEDTAKEDKKIETRVEEPPIENDVKTNEEVKEDPKDEEPKVTKEMIRERLGAIMKAGKQKEVKELVAKYGAERVPDLKEEDYVAVYKEAEVLL
jgi:hypothetical protein